MPEKQRNMLIKRLSHKTLSLLSGGLLCALAACGGPSPVPVGDWRSTLGRADIRFVEKDSGAYAAIVAHRIHGGGTCHIEYPVVKTTCQGCYIQAEGRIVVSYDPEKDRLFLSPGGTYVRKREVRQPDADKDEDTYSPLKSKEE